MKNKKIIIAVACILVLWIAVGIVDYGKVHSFEKPIFCVGTELADDGGSGKYVGLGYSFDIEGNFMPVKILFLWTTHGYDLRNDISCQIKIMFMHTGKGRFQNMIREKLGRARGHAHIKTLA